MKSIASFLKTKSEFLWNRFNQLSKRERRAAGATLAVISLWILDAAILKPIQKNIDGLNQKISVEEKKVMHNVRSVEQKPRVDVLLSQLTQRVDFSSESDEKTRASMLEDIEKYARERRIYLTEVKPQVSEQEAGHKEYRIRIQMEGVMSELLSFLADLVRTRKLYRVENLRIVPHAEDVNKVKATVTVNRVIITHNPAQA